MLMRCSFGKAVVHSGWHYRRKRPKASIKYSYSKKRGPTCSNYNYRNVKIYYFLSKVSITKRISNFMVRLKMLLTLWLKTYQ